MWLYGSLYDDDGEMYILPNFPGSAIDYEDYQVDPITVGEYLGRDDADGKPLGDKHLRGMALQAFKVNERPEPFLQNIQKAVDDYTGSIPQANDLTMMVIGRK